MVSEGNTFTYRVRAFLYRLLNERFLEETLKGLDEVFYQADN